MALIITAAALALGLGSATTVEPTEGLSPEPPAAVYEPPAASAEQQPTDPLNTLVVVDVAFEGGEQIEALLHTEIVAALREAHVDPRRPEQEPLAVTVSPDAEGLGTYEVIFRHRGEVLRSWACPCSGEELRARLVQDAVDVWHEIIATNAEAPPAPASLTPAAPIGPAPRRAERRRERGRGLRIAGITTTALGTALVVGTAALLAGDEAADRDLDISTLAMLGSGTALLITGVTLWSVGAHPRERPRLSIRPALGSRGATMIMGGRF